MEVVDRLNIICEKTKLTAWECMCDKCKQIIRGEVKKPDKKEGIKK